jgi:hypothetical protein
MENWLVVRSLHSQPFGAFSHKEFLADLLHVWLCATECPFLAHFITRIFSGFIACATVFPSYLMLKQGEVRAGDEGAGVQQEAPGPAAWRRSGTAAGPQETTGEKGQKMLAILLISSKKAFFRAVMYSDIFNVCPNVCYVR